jgi:uncharacterized protein (DUF1499 family)
MAESTHPETRTVRTWWSRAILIGAVLAVVLLPIGALGVRFDLWSFMTGFGFLGASTILAAIGLIVGIAGIVAARRRQLKDDKPAVYLGTLLCFLVLALMGMQFFTVSSVPPIHDISTDTADPPEFSELATQRGPAANSLDYGGEEVAAAQQAAYPWVVPLETALDPKTAVTRAAATLTDMGLEVVVTDPERGRVEAIATTFWFGFRDDLVVRVRPAASGSGSIVDVRSVSRVGVSDLGANARRIGRFLERFPTE